MPKNLFYEKKGPFPLNEVIKAIGYNGNFSHKSNFEIYGFESLDNASENDMTFLNSIKYKDLSLKTKALACITSSSLSKFLPEKCIKLDVKNILFAVTQASKMFYPNADIDFPDENLLNSDKVKTLYLDVKFGKNVLIGKNVKIGKNCMIAGQVGFAGSTILGDNVVIGGQAGISGHLKIGNNVKIGGGSGVINDIPDNHQVMGYPAVSLKNFVKQRKK